MMPIATNANYNVIFLDTMEYSSGDGAWKKWVPIVHEWHVRSVLKTRFVQVVLCTLFM